MTESKTGVFQAEWKAPRLTPRQVKLTLIGVMFAMFLASLDQTIVATAIPRIMADLDGFDQLVNGERTILLLGTQAQNHIN